MRKLTLLISAAAIIGFAGAATAGDPQGKAAGHGCDNMNILPPDNVAKNPGKMFQIFKEAEFNFLGGPNAFQGLNPHEIAVLAGNIDTDKVKQFIETHCDNSPS